MVCAECSELKDYIVADDLNEGYKLCNKYNLICIYLKGRTKKFKKMNCEDAERALMESGKLVE